MPVEFLYTPGAAGLRFFQTLKQKGVLTATHCDECNVTYLPPRVYCENCFADLSNAWRDVAGSGRVHTFTVVHVDREGRRLAHPEVIAFVRIDGTDGGLVTRRRALLSDIVGFTPMGSAPASKPQRRRRR
jgi:uncharacterized OB-fold protein